MSAYEPETPSKLPPMGPDTTCNARLSRSSGYCDAIAGEGTDHEGHGRCRLHGGATPKRRNSPLDMFRAMGLGPIIQAAEKMDHSDQEYIYEVSNAALVITRAGIVARMQNADASPKELADLSMALQRVDGLLAKYLNDEDPDKAPNEGPSSLDAEAARLVALEKKLS